MKNILIILLMIVSTTINAQFTLEHIYPQQPGIQFPLLTDLGNNNFKYWTVDAYQNQINLYNLDHTPYMLSIQIPMSLDSGFYGVGYITNALFDCDSTTIEYAVLRSVPAPEGFTVYRTDGTLLFKKDSVTTPYCYGCTGGALQFNGITNTNDGTKLMLFDYNNTFYVYSLCGTLPTSINEPFQESNYVRAFPNPSSHALTLEIDPPDNLYEYKLLIYNSKFQTMKTCVVKGYTKINLDTGDWSNDSYFYSLQDNRKVFQSAKFIISK